MTRWALLTIALYVALLAVLTLPVLALAAWRLPESDLVADLFTSGWYWLVIGILGLAQALLLVVPVRAAKRVAIKRRHVLVPVVVASVLVLLLLAGAVASVMAAVFADDVFEQTPPEPLRTESLLGAGVALVVMWLFWVFIFRMYAHADSPPEGITERITTSLLAGSILELLVAVSCHIVVRRRGDCSAPGLTFLGIAAGLAVMLMAFGPGLFWVFARRRERITPKISAV